MGETQQSQRSYARAQGALYRLRGFARHRDCPHRDELSQTGRCRTAKLQLLPAT